MEDIYRSLMSQHKSLCDTQTIHHYSTSTSSCCKMWNLFRKLNPVPTVHALNPMPTVHALNPMPTVHALEEESPTSVDRLNKKPTVLITETEVRRYMEKETGQGRVRELFSLSGSKELHPDMTMVADSVKFCGLTVFLTTSVFGSINAKEAFIRRSQHKTYETKFKAMRAYNDAVVLGGMKFGLRWALKGALFTSFFLVTSQTIATYRNKTSLWEYIGGGCATGAFLRMNLGLKGMFAGSVIGGILGVIGGSCMYLLLYSSNEMQQQRHYWRVQDNLRKRREIELQFPKVSPTSPEDLKNPLPS